MTPVANLPPVSLIPLAICLRHRWHRRHRWQICHRCQQHKGNWWQNLPPVSLIPVANLPPVSLKPAAICHQWHRWCTLTCEYLPEFSKKFEMILKLLPGAWGKVIHEKNLKQKSRDTVPLSLKYSVGDPDQHSFGPPGSESISQICGSRSRSRSFPLSDKCGERTEIIPAK